MGGDARYSLKRAWASRHAPIRDADLPRCRPPRTPAVLFRLSTCFHAGRCLCGDGTGKKPVAEIPHAARGVLGEVFKKGQPARALYNKGIVVVCVTQPGETPASGHWFHTGMGNLADRHFTLRELQHRSSCADGSYELYAYASRPVSLYALLDLEVKEAWDLQLFYVDTKDTRLVPGAFVPEKHVRVQPMEPAVIKQLWRPGPRGGERKLPVRGLPAPRALMDVEGEEVAEEPSPAECFSGSEGDDVGGGLRRAGRDLAVEDWQLEDDSDIEPGGDDPDVGDVPGGVPPRPDDGVEPVEPGGGVYAPPGGEAPPMPPPAAHPEAAEHPAPADGVAPRAPPVFAAARAARRPKFPTIVYEEVAGRQSLIRLSSPLGKAWYDIRGVCGWHDGCTLSKSCRTARPLGLVWAWLARASEYETKDEHKEYIPSLEECAAASLDASLKDGHEQFLEAAG